MGKKTEGPQSVEVAETESMSWREPEGRVRKVLIRESQCSKRTLSNFTGLPLDNIYLSYWMITSVLWIYLASEDNCRVPCLILCPSMTLPYFRMIFICEFK